MINAVPTMDTPVPKSGSMITRPKNTPVTSSGGTSPFQKLFMAWGREAAKAAIKLTNASLLSSDGWRLKTPRSIQRREPETLVPITKTAASSPPAASTPRIATRW